MPSSGRWSNDFERHAGRRASIWRPPPQRTSWPTLSRNMASSLGLREETVVRTHLGTIDVAALATGLVRADEAQKREVAEASPAVISLEGAGRLVASLAQAIRCVSLNHEQLTRGDSDKWGAIGVLVQIERPRPAEPAWSTLPHFPRRGGR